MRDISNVKQEIISYRKVIKPERSTLRVLERRANRFLPEELELYFDDINDAVERIWDQLDNYKEVVEALESTNESVISHRQNDVLRLLTIISVTMLPLTLITSVFGMNVLFPGEATSTAFWIILAALVATLATMIGFFRWKAGCEDSCGLRRCSRASRPHRDHTSTASHGSIRARIRSVRASSGAMTCVYTSRLMDAFEWPIRSASSRAGIPFACHSEPRRWRRSCGE